jgi:hypothetical protein
MSENPNEQGLMADVNPDAVAPPDPNDPDITSITEDEIDMIERLVFAEAGTEGEEGRDAVRGVIFNRLSSDRFPNSVREVIEQRGQFEPIGTHGSVENIPVPEDKLESQKYEMDAYLNTGIDASGGRTFFLNKDIAKRRGTDFSGDKPLTIGKHTFYSGFPGQEPVRVSPTSHNITVVDSRPGTIEQLMDGTMAPVITEDAVAPASDQEALVADTGSQFASLAPTNDTASTPSPRLSTATDDVLSNFTTRDRSDVGSQTRSMFNLDAPGTMENYDADTGRVNTGILQSIREALGFAEGGMAVSGNQDIEPPQGDGSVLLPYEPTLQEKAKYAISGFLQDKFGMGNYEANDLSEKFTGNPNATDGSYGIGLADFTPAGLIFGADNAKDSFQRAKNSDDRLGMGLAVVEGGLAAAEAFPLTKLAARGAKQGIDKLSDVAANIDPNTVGSLGGNLFSSKPPDVNLAPEVDAGPALEVLDIRAAQMELATKDRIQPSGKDPLFNLTPEGYENTLPEQSEVYVPRQPQGTEQPLPKNNRAAFVNDNIEAISDRLAERMKPWLGTEAQYFYHTGPIVDKALGMGFSKEEIYSWLKDFSDAYAATSPRTKTADNLRNATLVMTKKHLGIPYDEIIGPNKGQRNEKGYAMIINRKGDISSSGKVANADGLHRKLLDTLDADGIDPNTNPKPYTFAQNVYGNLDGVTVDTHAVRGALSAVNEIDPGSIPIDYIKPKFRKQYAEDPTSLDPATMIDDSIGSQMIDGTDMQTEYAVFSDVYRRTAEKLGVSPAEAQSLGWFGSGDSTGLASELKSVASLIEDRIDVTAQGLGKPKEEVFKMLLNREIPVLQIFGTAGAGAAALGSMDEQMQQFSKGGLTQGESEKGIRTQEGKDMADKVFKLDFSKADINDDGKLSEYEKARGEAIQKATNEEDGIMMAAHGGMPCGCGGDCDGSCGDDGSMPGMIVGTDPVSGNEIPLGSEAENVRDDIPAMLSEGEYVLPADVVKWHGLKHITGMMMEAKAGLMSLQAMGQIHEVEEVFYDEEEEYSDDMVECPECGGEGCEHCDGMGYHTEAEESYETSEGNEVDIAEVITEEETPEYDEEEDTVETVSYAMKSTPKIAFIR